MPFTQIRRGQQLTEMATLILCINIIVSSTLVIGAPKRGIFMYVYCCTLITCLMDAVFNGHAVMWVVIV